MWNQVVVVIAMKVYMEYGHTILGTIPVIYQEQVR